MTGTGVKDRLELRLTGFGGQGVVLAAHIIGRACIEAGRHATMIQSFGPEARGASCSATLVVSPDEVLYPYIQQPEILVAMSSEGYDKFHGELRPGGTLIYESDLVKPSVILSEATDLPESNGEGPSPSSRLRMTRSSGQAGLITHHSSLITPVIPHHSSLITPVLPPLPPRSFGIPSTRIAETLKKPMVQNIVMLGFVTRVTGLVPVETMRAVVRASVPAGTEEINLQAFDAGAAYFDQVVRPQEAVT